MKPLSPVGTGKKKIKGPNVKTHYKTHGALQKLNKANMKRLSKGRGG